MYVCIISNKNSLEAIKRVQPSKVETISIILIVNVLATTGNVIGLWPSINYTKQSILELVIIKMIMLMCVTIKVR